ncbi:MAG: AAA family ATPase [Bacteroidetes bacterium]|nr:AAA family ATPase [Bacteroidota bacterium]
MEIKSIKEIQNISTFKDFKGGDSCHFKKLTFIYGLNTYGKTTLTDICQSLKDNNLAPISSRKTISDQSDKQKVLFSIKENSIKGKVLNFKNNSWDENKIAKYIEVFGEDFIDKNLFTGSFINRENKKNFTEFILGEEGVNIVREIEKKKQSINKVNQNLKNGIPEFLKEKMRKK